MIGVDWGTSSFRAFRLAPDGAVLARVEAPLGILQVPGSDFGQALASQIGPWLADGEDRVLLSGMIGSRQGWVEAPYVPCPAGAADLAAAAVPVPFAAATTRLVPGLSATDAAGVPEVMRGEETQIIGILAAIGDHGRVCLPGTHAKWAHIEAGRIASFTTHMTGEAFAALRGHTILGRLMPPDAAAAPAHPAAFDRGLARAADPGGLLHHLFGVRTLGLTGALPSEALPSYLSGLLIGHEVRAAAPAGHGLGGQTVHLVGAPPLVALYASAIEHAGGRPVFQDSDAAASGLATIGALTEWP